MSAPIATWNDYVLLANRTAKPLAGPAQLEHARWGLITEVGELFDLYKRCKIYGKPWDLNNFREEIGDICWYVALETFTTGAVIELPLEITVADNATVEEQIHSLVMLAADAVQAGRSMNAKAVLYTAARLCKLHEVDIWQCMRLNIAKLAARYGDKYSDEAALIRNLTLEAKVLAGE